MKKFAVYVFRRGLDFFKEKLCISVGQREAEQPAVKVGGQKKILPLGPIRTRLTRDGPSGRIFFQTSNFDGNTIETKICSVL